MSNWKLIVAVVAFVLYFICFVFGEIYLPDSLKKEAEYKNARSLYVYLGITTVCEVVCSISLLLLFNVFSATLSLLSSLLSFDLTLNVDSFSFITAGIITMIVAFTRRITEYLFVRKAIVAFIVDKVPFFNTATNDLIACLLMEKNKKNLITYSSLFLSFVAEYIIYRKTPEISMLIAMVLTLAMLALCFANQQVLYYRLKCGLYGTCSSEAREIIAYIMEQLKNKDNSGGGLPKLVFKEEELVERVLRTDGGEEYAG